MNNLDWEKNWWGNCCNTYGEETKQLLYAQKMGLQFYHNGKSPYFINMQGKSVLDIGGGPCSLLLKCENVDRGVVVDPCDYPNWVKSRYVEAGIDVLNIKAEDFCDVPIGIVLPIFDEVWIYNCLQHVENPKKVIENAKKLSKIIRIFEWVDNGVSEGHPNDLKEEELNKWLGGIGKVEYLNTKDCIGKCYYGVFIGDNY